MPTVAARVPPAVIVASVPRRTSPLPTVSDRPAPAVTAAASDAEKLPVSSTMVRPPAATMRLPPFSTTSPLSEVSMIASAVMASFSTRPPVTIRVRITPLACRVSASTPRRCFTYIPCAVASISPTRAALMSMSPSSVRSPMASAEIRAMRPVPVTSMFGRSARSASVPSITRPALATRSRTPSATTRWLSVTSSRTARAASPFTVRSAPASMISPPRRTVRSSVPTDPPFSSVTDPSSTTASIRPATVTVPSVIARAAAR